MSDTHLKADLAVLGGGPGGYPAAFLAADLGMDVVLVDPEENPGGVCLYRGCIPSKALLHAAKIIRQAKEAAAFGLDFRGPSIDLGKLRAFVTDVVATLTGGLGQLGKARQIRHIRARGRLRDEHTLELTPLEGDATIISFDTLILAAGSSPNRLRHAPETSRLWSSDDALALPEIPGRLLVVGGGYIGLELGTAYAALGSAVTVAEMTGSLLPGVDPDLTRPLKKRLDALFEEILLETEVSGFSPWGAIRTPRSSASKTPAWRWTSGGSSRSTSSSAPPLPASSPSAMSRGLPCWPTPRPIRDEPSWR
jgi:dihydrolipoamide dehydrogenase